MELSARAGSPAGAETAVRRTALGCAGRRTSQGVCDRMEASLVERARPGSPAGTPHAGSRRGCPESAGLDQGHGRRLLTETRRGETPTHAARADGRGPVARSLERAAPLGNAAPVGGAGWNDRSAHASARAPARTARPANPGNARHSGSTSIACRAGEGRRRQSAHARRPGRTGTLGRAGSAKEEELKAY